MTTTEDLLERHLVSLVHKEPFYSYLSRSINKHESDKISTAGVYAKDGELHLLWCPKFIKTLTDLQIQELLKHEFLHLVLGHCTTRTIRRNGKPDPVWFFACDLAINSLLDIDNLPPGGLVPGRWTDIPAGHRHLYTKEYVESNIRLSKFVRSLPLAKSANWYYEKILANPDVVKDIEKGGGPDPIDTHDMWDNMTDAEREVIERKVKGVFDQAVSSAEKDIGGWGSMPYEARRLLKKRSGDASLDWDSLRYFCGTLRSDNRVKTFKRLSRRYSDLPGVKRKRIGRVAVAVDVSGSVTDNHLSRVFAELENLAEKVEFTVIPFDSTVDENSVFVWKRGEKISPYRDRSGATDFNAPTKWVNENRARFDGMIIITDGLAREPIACLLRRSWVLIPNTLLLFKTEELIVRMN